jgi:hypothetical protein
MRIIVPLVLLFDYNTEAWAHERGIAETDACPELAALLHRTVDDGAVAAALDTVLPVPRGHITAHSVDALDGTTRDDLLRRLRESRDADQDQALLDEIREHLAEHRRELGRRRPRWVIFRTMEWDNGHFLTGSDATVYFANGDNVPVDFHGSGVDDLLTDMYGVRGAMAALGVDLRAGTLEFDDYADNVPDLLGIPASNHQRG